MVSATHEEQMGLNSPASPHAGDSRTQKCGDSILLVEDDKPTLRLERVIPEEAGYLVEGVGSGEAALECIAEEPPASVILDNGLPGMDGFTTCRRIREFSQVPVVMVTGNKTAADRKRGKASGADAYVTKPFLADNLVDLVAEFITEAAEYSDDAGEWEEKGSQPVDAHNPVDEEEPEDHLTKVAVAWNSQHSQEQQSPLEDSAPADEPTDGPEYPGQDVNQSDPSSAVALDQGKSSAASMLEQQPAGCADKSEDDSAFSPPALPAGAPAETGNADEDPDSAAADELTDLPDVELYEGTVRLMVASSGPVKNLLNFVGELRQNTLLRLLRLVASQRSESMDIWLGLREPLYLITVLGDIPGVSQVAALPDLDGDEEERQVSVTIGL